MKSEAVKIQESKERIAMIQAAKEVLTDPAVMAIAGFLLIEFLQSSIQQVPAKVYYSDGSVKDTFTNVRLPGGGWVGSVAGSVLEAGLAGMAVVSPLAKSGALQQAIASSSDMSKALLPLLAKVV